MAIPIRSCCRRRLPTWNRPRSAVATRSLTVRRPRTRRREERLRVNLLVLDESLELAMVVGRIAPVRGWEPHFVGSLHELELAVQTHGRPALTVVNLQPPLTAWELGQRLRGLGLESPVVVLGAAGQEGGAPALAGGQWLGRASGGGRGGRSSGGSRAAGHGLVGQSAQLGEVLGKIEKVAPGDANVCISGESGTGKELIARAIHAQSARWDRPLVTLDCTAIPEGLMESHLFGDVGGGFA